MALLSTSAASTVSSISRSVHPKRFIHTLNIHTHTDLNTSFTQSKAPYSHSTKLRRKLCVSKLFSWVLINVCGICTDLFVAAIFDFKIAAL